MLEVLRSISSAGNKPKAKAVDPAMLTNGRGSFFLRCLIEANFCDMALCLIKQIPEFALEISHNYGISRLSMSALEMMVRRPFAFQSGTKLTWGQNLIYSLIQVDMNSTYFQPVKPNKCQSECPIRDEENPLPEVLNCTKAEESSKFSTSSSTYKRHVMPYITKVIGIERQYNQNLMNQQASALIKQMFVDLKKETNAQTLMKFFDKNPNIMKTAIKNGITEFVAECLEKFDSLIWPRISGETMLETAIIERKEMIANILETSDKFDETITLLSRVDLDDGNTILHYAAKRASSAQLNLISRAALQMQREMQWFKGVQSILRESDRLIRNKNGDPAQFVFSEEHKDLLKEGEDWLKDTSGSCMIVAALIATVAFAAAFTVPGGNISDSNSALNGTPVFLGNSSFTLFAIADALALFSSITSVLMFLAIYTSRYAEIDFLKSLPQKLIFGLTTRKWVYCITMLPYIYK
ncbi:ankyrin repeat-containing protein ITN1-like isoform X1 [Papaver somniferum]|uniref:ankyrin repeat-containing protein ITN1-like isoform X1 n=1 Tax=Papaver somniferum TaxID=3469 RepID=UPI000E705000|nr:ankyrin repeat-containing protein ITN1-like isoform X1 [Papaver somniferum]